MLGLLTVGDVEGLDLNEYEHRHIDASTVQTHVDMAKRKHHYRKRKHGHGHFSQRHAMHEFEENQEDLPSKIGLNTTALAEQTPQPYSQPLNNTQALTEKQARYDGTRPLGEVTQPHENPFVIAADPDFRANNKATNIQSLSQAQATTEQMLLASQTPIMLASLDTQLNEASQLATKAHSKDERNMARAKILELRDSLQRLKENVLREANSAKERGDFVIYKIDDHTHHARYGNEATRRIETWVKEIADKVPQITKLEHKIGMLQGLDPILENIVKDLDAVTDFRSLDYYNQIWNYNNAGKFGTIEGSSMMPLELPIPKPGSYVPPALSYDDYLTSHHDTHDVYQDAYYDPEGKVKVIDRIQRALVPKTSNQQVEHDLKTHMDKLKRMIGKTDLQQKTELEIEKAKQEADEKIRQEQIKADQEVAELKKRVTEA